MIDVSALSPDGWTGRWQHWDGRHAEELTLTWENEAWTASGLVADSGVQYVIRLSPRWAVRQFLLFRDLDEPDLWLATDADGRWGEMNGVYRPEFDRATDVHLPCTPFTTTLPLRRFAGDPTADEFGVLAVPTIEIDVETLETTRTTATLARRDDGRWERRSSGDEGDDAEVISVDEHGFAVDVEGRFRRA